MRYSRVVRCVADHVPGDEDLAAVGQREVLDELVAPLVPVLAPGQPRDVSGVNTTLPDFS